MRIISLDLLLGAPRLQRRINAEMALLQRDLAAVHDHTQQLRTGVVRAATSLPALAAAAAGGFLVAKIARAPRRPRAAVEEPREASAASAALTASTSLAWQFLMPLAIGWLQARFAPQEETAHTKGEEAEDLPAKS